ncbi:MULTISPECIES: hypothetical protein [unclassified Streptomyces]|uniref:hypothetical protein n=1 Tax=unclassified Streptomyces TaxID=2593676 RepID=UPI0029B2E65E|nr:MULTISPECIES: hypothetical protein [unclassified Streptomyces]MDX3772152.1 hypothetical protein [Streptomyces sp. AK08-01B]MDX3821679.1 hypothetical protein [Streptomyces sp. AK08-01A]
MSDYEFVRRILWENVPEVRSAIVDIEDEQREFEEAYPEAVGSGVSIYSIASDAFIADALAPLLRSDEWDEGLACRCSKVIDSLLSFGGEEVRQMVSIRITDYILGWGYWSRFQECAGPALQAEVNRRKHYYLAPD